MRLLCVHAHYDDFEFVAAGTFDRIKQQNPGEVTTKLVVCTDGAAGHHFRGLDETRELRWNEQKEASKLGGHEVERLRLPGGRLREEANPVVDREFLAALWRTIRAFEPDYLFCPPIPQDPLAGVHVDHVAVAEAVRKVAYMINVPHAFIDLYPELEGPAMTCKVPVILNTYDAYMAGANPFDFVVDVESAFGTICDMAWCHQSQVCEWLPWVGRHRMPVPASKEEWDGLMRERFDRQNRELGLPLGLAVEAFMVSAWGTVPSIEQIERDFPGMIQGLSEMSNLKERLARLGLRS